MLVSQRYSNLIVDVLVIDAVATRVSNIIVGANAISVTLSWYWMKSETANAFSVSSF